MLMRCAAVCSPMMSTVFAELRLLLLFCFLLSAAGGCALFSREEVSFTSLQSAVKRQMLKLQSSELLAAAAQEKYQPRKAADVFAQGIGYQENLWAPEKDPALQVLEEAIIYALIARSADPAAMAEKIIASQLDYGIGYRLVKLQKGSASERNDAAAELAMMTGWSPAEVEKYIDAPLPAVKVEPFPLYYDAEQLLDEKGAAAAFETAAELYRAPDEAGVNRAERLRRALLNRILIQIKSPGAVITPELRIAFLRGRIFDGILKGI